MRILDTNEVEDIVSRGTRLPDSKLGAILDELEKDHPGVYRVIYGEPSDAIAIVNKDMADLYLNLSFDVVWVFKDQFGKPPEVHDEERWGINQIIVNRCGIEINNKTSTNGTIESEESAGTLRKE